MIFYAYLLLLAAGPLLAGPSMDKNLYSKEKDPGIISVEGDELDKLIQGSSKPWMVQFYSSWCGHCIHFQPTFSEFGARVEGWTVDTMGLAVINCASERNTQTCRDYDIMGYPTLKVFPSKAAKGDRGQPLQPTPHEVPKLMEAMVNWVQEQQAKDPSIEPNLNIGAGPSEGLAVLEKAGSVLPYSVQEVILDFYAATKHMEKKVSLSRMDLATYGQKYPGSNAQFGTVVRLPENVLLGVPQSYKELADLAMAQHNKTYPEAPLTSLKYTKHEAPVSKKAPKAGSSPKPQAATNPEEVKRRRYTVFLRDAETAMMYAFSHEIGQRRVIGGKSLTTLKQLVNVLRLYYPKNQVKTHEFLDKLNVWISAKDDAIKGSDFEEEIAKLAESSGHKQPQSGNIEWVGCKGSKPLYGGYPCGLWTLWHLLTVQRYVQNPTSQSAVDNREVLMAMVNYVDDFFGCRDCARHFLTMAENGAAVTRDVETAQDAILWLWKAHNRVNVRLKDDVSDDPVFPKKVFPDKENCPACYNEKIGGYNLDVEFFKDHVRDFLVGMFDEHLNYSGTQFTVETAGAGESKGAGDSKVAPPNVPAVRYNAELPDDTNFLFNPDQPKSRKNSDFRQNNQPGSTSVWFFSMADITVCFAVYMGSTLLILLICYKFCSKRLLLRIINKLFKEETPNRHGLGKMV